MWGGKTSAKKGGGGRVERTIDRHKEGGGVRKVAAPLGSTPSFLERRSVGVPTMGKEDWNSVAQFFYTAGPGR